MMSCSGGLYTVVTGKKHFFTDAHTRRLEAIISSALSKGSFTLAQKEQFCLRT